MFVVQEKFAIEAEEEFEAEKMFALQEAEKEIIVPGDDDENGDNDGVEGDDDDDDDDGSNEEDVKNVFY